MIMPLIGIPVAWTRLLVTGADGDLAAVGKSEPEIEKPPGTIRRLERKNHAK